MKRQRHFETLVVQLKRRKVICTAAIKHGIDEETKAAVEYSTRMNNSVNLYPCGIMISPTLPWNAASPDRKVYNPSRQPPFGLLEIKCPVKKSISDVNYLQITDGTRQLQRNHEYYFQIQAQLAVSGLDWYDFYFYVTKDNGEIEDFLEIVLYNPICWAEAQLKLDNFYFSYFI